MNCKFSLNSRHLALFQGTNKAQFLVLVAFAYKMRLHAIRLNHDVCVRVTVSPSGRNV